MNNLATTEELIQEAKSYMTLLHMNDNLINWMEGGIVTCSRPNCITSPLKDDEKDVIEELNRLCTEENKFVYHIIKNNTPFGEIYSFLYVDKKKDTWENEGRYTIRLKCPLLYAYNRDNAEYSEYGRAKVILRPGGTGLDRTDL